MVREHRGFFVCVSLACIAVRFFFFRHFAAVTDDSRVYVDLAGNWLAHGIYGQMQLGQIVPTDARLPGYPAFLAGIFSIFGAGNVRAVLIAQLLLDLLSCFVIADLARRIVSSRRAALAAFFLAATCPFLANYAAAVLTETLEILFTSVALDCAIAGLDATEAGKAAMSRRLFAATGLAIAACILLRPDGGILLAAFGVSCLIAIVRRKGNPMHSKTLFATVVAGMLVVGIALAPLVPWTIRNLRTLHHFQPLAPRYANESAELSPRGFNRWVKTWIADYASVEEIYWNVPGDKIDVAKLPARALDEPPPRNEPLALIADYNQSQDLPPQLDARFGELAAERIRARPFRYYLVLPSLRMADMWLRPRTELLPPDIRWWEFNDDPRESALALGFGGLNLLYIGAAVVALVRQRARLRHLVLLGGFILIRTLFLGTIGNPEPRYTLECYPVIFVLVSAAFCRAQEFDAA